MTLDPTLYRKIEEGEPYGKYILVPPPLSPTETKVMEILRSILSARASLNQFDLSFLGEKKEDFVTLIRDTLRSIPPRRLYSPGELLSIAEEILEDLRVIGLDNPYVAIKSVYDGLGLGDLEFLLYDEELEDIMVNGYDKPVFVYHEKFGYLETNLRLGKELRSIAKKIASYLGVKPPITGIDGRLPDGSRVNIVGEGISDGGPSITIRKFRKERLNIVDIIRKGTMTTELASYLWLMVEGMGISPFNVIVAGNTGGGKTTTLMALIDLIPLKERIITIEDTRELTLIHPNWVSLSRESDGLNMVDLLINALRMRPDRIVVGEVRGPEAETLLAAMNVGHVGLGTLHANSARDTIRRLTSPPMNVPKEMLPVLNLIVVQHRIRMPGKGEVRRVTEVVELSPLEGGVNLTPVFRWDPSKDKIERTNVPSSLLDRLSEYLHLPKQELKEELERRKRILELAVKTNLGRKELISLVNTYYFHPEKLEKVMK